MSAPSFCTMNGGRLIFTQDAWDLLLRHRQVSPNLPEAGGVLFGRHLLNSQDVAVDGATTPQPQDRQSRFFFFRSRRHSEIVLREWEASRHTQDCLGLWHTHPEHSPTPSYVDVQDWKRAVKKGTYDGHSLFFVIVGVTNVGVWELPRKGKLLLLQGGETNGFQYNQ